MSYSGKYPEDDYRGVISSHYSPGQLRTTPQNDLSDLHHGENVSVKTGVTQNVTQSVKKSIVSSRKSSGYSSEEGRKEDDYGNSNILNSGISGALGSSMDVESYGFSPSSGERFHLVDRPKPTDLSFQYEDIQSFKERQKVEGDRLQMHRQSLTGNIVGTGKHGMMKSEYTSSSESKPFDSDVFSSYSSRITNDKTSNENAPLSRDSLFAEARGGSNDHFGFPSNSSTSIVSSSSHREHLSRDKLISDAGNQGVSPCPKSSSSSFQGNNSPSRESRLAEARNKGAASQSSFQYSRDLSRWKEDIIGGSSNNHLSSSALSDSDSRMQNRGILDDKLSKQEDLRVPQEDRFSKSDALVAKYLQSSRDKGLLKHGNESNLDVNPRLPPLSGIREETRDYSVNKEGSTKDKEIKHHSVGKPMTYLSSSSSYEDLLQRKKELVADSKPAESAPSGITSESYSTRYKHSDVPGSKPTREADKISNGSRDVSIRLSAEIRDERKARQDAIDRLLQSTRRYSSENILDKKSHDKNLDDVLSASERKELETSSKYDWESRGAQSNEDRSHEARYDREAGGLRLEERGSQGIDGTGQDGSARDLSDKTRESNSYDTEATKHSAITRDGRVQRYIDSNYETPYTTLDHSYKPMQPFPVNNDEPIYDQPLKPGEYPSQPKVLERGQLPRSVTKPPEGTPHGIYDKLRRGSGHTDKPSYEVDNVGLANPDKRRGSTEAELEPIYDHLNSSGLKQSRGRGSPVPISEKYNLPLDEYEKPVAVHGRSHDHSKSDDPRRSEILSRYPDPKDNGLTDYVTGQRRGVAETTWTSYMERNFMSRNGEVIKDETKRHEEVRHDGRSEMENPGRRGSSPELPTRIQRYPPAKADNVLSDRRPSNSSEQRKTEESSKLDDILKKTAMNIRDTGDNTNFQEYSRKDEITRIRDDPSVRTKVHRTDVHTNVNIVKEVVTERKEKPKQPPAKSGIAGLRAKIEALTKSVDELMNYKHKTILRSYVQEHGNRRPSKDLEALPKPEYYEVKSKRYEPDIKLDEVDYLHKEVEIKEPPMKPKLQHEELNIENMWIAKDQQDLDLGLRIPKQINLSGGDNETEWWNAPTAEDADRFLCIGDWQWWNANTTEGVDHILGIRAINKDTGAAGAIIAKYQGDEKPIEWAWLQAPHQPSPSQKRRTITRAFGSNQEIKDDWWDAPTAEDADKHLSIGHYKWWDVNRTEGVEKVLGVQGSADETGTILATYEGGTKPTAWTWVQTSEQPSDRKEEKRHTITRSSRDVYIDETNTGNVELLVRVKDEETTAHQQPRYLAIRPGPIEKAIIIREIVESDIPPYASDLTVEGKSGEGLEIQDGVVKMQIKDMTPEARKAWIDIMGIEKKNFKLKDSETLEIPVKVVDHPKPNEDIYAVPIKKKKKSQKTTNDEKDDKPKIPSKRKLSVDQKREIKNKEIEKERKKQEQKAKKLEEKKRKEEKEIIKKKAKENESEKKKKEIESKKKKKEIDSAKNNETESQKKKKQVEKMKERESEKRKREQLVKKISLSNSKEKLSAEKVGPPLIDRSLKPKPKTQEAMQETRDQETTERRRSSADIIDGAQVNPATYSPTRKPGPFALSHKPERPKSTRGRINSTHNQAKSTGTMFEGTSTSPKRPSSSVKVLNRVNFTQNGPDKVKSGGRKSGGSQIAVPLRGGGKSSDGNGYAVVQHRRAQSQKIPAQHLKQTIIEKTQKTYRAETNVVDPKNGAYPVQQHLPLQKSHSDSQAKVHMIRSSGADPLNTAPVVKHKESHAIESRGLERRFSAELLDSVPLERRGSGHSVTNLSITSRASEKQPSTVQVVRRSSADASIPLERRGSNYSITNLSVTASRTIEDQPNVVQTARRSSDDQFRGSPVERRGSNHSVINFSSISNTAEGQPNVQIRRQSNDELKDAVPIERRGSSHSVRNLAVTSSPISEVQPTVRKVRLDSTEGSNLARLSRRISGDPWKIDPDFAAINKEKEPTTSVNSSFFREEKQTPLGYMKREIVKKTVWSEQQSSPNKK